MLRLPGVRDIVFFQPIRCLLVGQVAEAFHVQILADVSFSQTFFLDYALHELYLTIGGRAAPPGTFGRGIRGLGNLLKQATIRSGLSQWHGTVGLRPHPAKVIEETRVKPCWDDDKGWYRRLVVVVIHDFHFDFISLNLIRMEDAD